MGHDGYWWCPMPPLMPEEFIHHLVWLMIQHPICSVIVACWYQIASYIRVNTALGNGLVPCISLTKFTYQQWGLLLWTIALEMHQSATVTKLWIKLLHLKLHEHLPTANDLTHWVLNKQDWPRLKVNSFCLWPFQMHPLSAASRILKWGAPATPSKVSGGNFVKDRGNLYSIFYNKF